MNAKMRKRLLATILDGPWDVDGTASKNTQPLVASFDLKLRKN